MAGQSVDVEWCCWRRLQSFVSQSSMGKPERVLLGLVDSLGVEGHELRVTRTIGKGSGALDSAFGLCLFELARLICERFPGGQVRIAAPAEWAWCAYAQFVEPPVRFFFERTSSDGDFNLNMATVVAGAEE